jgi:hypothetical protein
VGGRRRGGTGAGTGGEDDLHGAGVLDGGDDTQPAATARVGAEVGGSCKTDEGSHAVQEVLVIPERPPISTLQLLDGVHPERAPTQYSTPD